MKDDKELKSIAEQVAALEKQYQEKGYTSEVMKEMEHLAKGLSMEELL